MEKRNKLEEEINSEKKKILELRDWVELNYNQVEYERLKNQFDDAVEEFLEKWGEEPSL